MANDHLKGSITVDYAKSPLAVYRDIIAFQNSSPFEASEKRVDMVYFSGLVRTLLSRESGLIRKPAKHFGYLADPDSWTYSCNDGYCLVDTSGNIALFVVGMDLLTDFKNWLLSFIIKSKVKYAAVWYPPEPEVAEVWLPTPSTEVEVEGIRVRGAIAGQIQYIGPSSSDILASFDTTRRWAASLAEHVPNEVDLRKARGRNERLMNLLGASADFRIRNIISFDADVAREEHHLHTSSKHLAEDARSVADGSRLFIGSEITLGLVPPNAKVGDVICQFWNSSASAVLRRTTNGGYHMVGRAGIVREGESIDWDMPTDREVFGQDSEIGVDLRMDINVLTLLSFDTVRLPATA